MARALSPSDKAGLVVGLCQNPAVYERLVCAATVQGLTDSTARAAGTGAALRALGERLSSTPGEPARVSWANDFHRLDRLDELSVVDDLSGDPLLEACFKYLAKMPGGGAPWQGSWRSNALTEVVQALRKGGIILVVEAHSLGEQRDWARALLKSGCAFVQTHDGPATVEISY